MYKDGAHEYRSNQFYTITYVICRLIKKIRTTNSEMATSFGGSFFLLNKSIITNVMSTFYGVSIIVCFG